MKLENGAPFGISPFLGGMDDNGNMKDFFYKNFAVVVEPACKECFINLSDDKLNMDVNNLSIEEMEKIKLGVTIQKDMSGSEVESNGLQKVEIKQELDSIQMKGGKKMAENEEKIEKLEEPIKEELKEEPVEVEEELSEDQLLEEIAKLAEKYMTKKKKMPEEDAMKKMQDEITSLKNELKKLSEIKVKEIVEKKEEVVKEKLSANPKTIARTIPKMEGFTFGGSRNYSGSLEFAAMLGY
jgi:hypothetical protein